MDPTLLRERELFKKKALATPAVEKKKKDTNVNPKKDEFKNRTKTPESNFSSLNYKTVGGNSEFKFSILAKIVKYMKIRHLQGEDHSLSLDEILDETNQLYVTSKVKQWLQTESLVSNPKIEVTSDNKFIFKPPYKIKDKKALLKLLKNYDLRGLGGILLDDIQESLPHSEKALRQLQNDITYISRTSDKKKVVFYNDKSYLIPVDEEFKKLWRSVAVENMDDDKIEEYLDKQGILSMQNYGIKKVAAPIKRKRPNNKGRFQKKPKDNQHVADVLETYNDLP